MKRAAVLALATAVSVAGIAETTPEARAAEAPPATRSLDQIRAEALTAMRNGDLQEVRKRGNRGWRGGKRSFRGNRGWRGGRSYSRGRYNRGGRYYRGHRRGHGGAAVAAGIAGLAIGAAIASNQNRGYRTKRWCAQRFRSYDWRSGTYVASSGRRVACP